MTAHRYLQLKNGELELFDPVFSYLMKMTDTIPLVYINSVYNDIKQNKTRNHIITGITSKEEENFIKEKGGLLIELPTNNTELNFQEKYLKTILKKFNNIVRRLGFCHKTEQNKKETCLAGLSR